MDTIAQALLLSIAVLLVHLLEDVGTGFRGRFPAGESALGRFVGINVFVYAFALTALFLTPRGTAGAAYLARASACTLAMLLNGVGHIGVMVTRRHAFPGGVTASCWFSRPAT